MVLGPNGYEVPKVKPDPVAEAAFGRAMTLFRQGKLAEAEDAFAKNLPADAKFGYLPKPFSLKQLATTVKDVLEG